MAPQSEIRHALEWSISNIDAADREAATKIIKKLFGRSHTSPSFKGTWWKKAPSLGMLISMAEKIGKGDFGLTSTWCRIFERTLERLDTLLGPGKELAVSINRSSCFIEEITPEVLERRFSNIASDISLYGEKAPVIVASSLIELFTSVSQDATAFTSRLSGLCCLVRMLERGLTPPLELPEHTEEECALDGDNDEGAGEDGAEDAASQPEASAESEEAPQEGASEAQLSQENDAPQNEAADQNASDDPEETADSEAEMKYSPEPDDFFDAQEVIPFIEQPAEVIETNRKLAAWQLTRDPAACRELAELLEKRGLYAAACDCRRQVCTMTSSQEEFEEAFWQYLLERVRSTGLSVDDQEVRAFLKQFPDSARAKNIGRIFELTRRDARRAAQRLPIWNSNLRDWGSSPADAEKAILKEAAPLMSEDKIQALEFYHGAQRLLSSSIPICHALAQMQSALKLTAAASLSYKFVAANSPKPSLALDSWSKAIVCMATDGRQAQVEAELEQMKAANASSQLIEQTRTIAASKLSAFVLAAHQAETVKEADEHAGTAAAAEEKPADAPADVLPASEPAAEALPAEETLQPAPHKPQAVRYAAPASPQRHSLAEIPFPRELIGFTRARSGYTNFHPQAIRDFGHWRLLSVKEAREMFPNFGAAGFLYQDAADERYFKPERIFCAQLDVTNLELTNDSAYVTGLNAHYGHEIQPLSSAACIVVYPENPNFDLASDTTVTVEPGGSSSTLGVETAGEEEAVLALDGGRKGYAGPFKLRSTAQGRLYIPKVPQQTLAELTVWKSLSDAPDAGTLAIPATTRSGNAYLLRIAFIRDPELFRMETEDFMTDEVLLDALAEELPEFPSAESIASAIEHLPILAQQDRRKRLLGLIEKLRANSNFVVEAKNLALSGVLDHLRAEANAKETPVADILMAAVNSEPALKALRDKLAADRKTIEETLAAAIKQAEAEYEARLKQLAAEEESKRTELEATEAAIGQKKTFWNNELSRMVEAARLEMAKEAIAPLFAEAQHKTADAGSSASAIAAPRSTQDTPAADFPARAAASAAILSRRPGNAPQLREALIRAVAARRSYERDDIVNLLASVANNFLTIFSGEPGSGKTSICRILADALGLRGLESRLSADPAWENAALYERYLSVAVERGWTSKRDFLGYFNPLSKSFTSSDRRRMESFRLLDAEARTGSSDFPPFLMLLDEANLSPMEYYWADFMGICDGRSPSEREIVLGDSAVMQLPDQLRFLATINIDDTTEALSPRLIDRAWIIRLPEGPETLAEASAPEPVTVSWKDFAAAFGSPEGFTPSSMEAAAVSKALSPFCEHFLKAGMNVSRRSRLAAERYIATTGPLLGGGRMAALDHAVAQKFLPMIRSSGRPFRDWLDHLGGLCEKLPVSRGIIENMLKRGDANLNFYQYL